MNTEQIEAIYNTLIGVTVKEARVPEIENAFAMGSDCERWYAEMGEAYLRLCDRLGVEDEDHDVEIIIRSLLAIGEKLSFYMFRYGMEFSGK